MMVVGTADGVVVEGSAGLLGRGSRPGRLGRDGFVGALAVLVVVVKTEEKAAGTTEGGRVRVWVSVTVDARMVMLSLR